MMRLFKLLCCWGVVASLALVGFGCHTVHGAGQDVSSAGQHISNAAD